MTMKTAMTAYLPAALCFISLSACCLDTEPEWNLPSQDYSPSQGAHPGSVDSTNVGGSGGVWVTSTGGNAGSDAGVGGTSAPACSGCEAPGTNAPAPVIAPLCQFNNQCGRNGRCLDGTCQGACTSSSNCGTGDVCLNGFCQVNPNGGGACVFGSQCTGGTCINGMCHVKCATTCANAADICDQGVCKPNRNPSPQCKRSADCGSSGDCVNGACRTSCWDDRSCGAGTSGTVCMMGYCVAPQEVTPQCETNSQCGNGTTCVNAVCCTPR